MIGVENKHNILKYKYELGTFMAVLRLALALIAGAGAYYLYNKYGADLISEYDKDTAKYLIFALMGAVFSAFIFVTTFIALFMNGKPNRDVMLTATHITAPKSVTSTKIIEIALADITLIESIETNKFKLARENIKQANHRKLVITSELEKLTINTDGLRAMEKYDHLYANLVARLPAAAS